MNAIESIVECVRHGGALQIKAGSLDLAKPASFPASLVGLLRVNREAIMEILGRNIMIVRTRLDPDHPMFWCLDAADREFLIVHGAPEGSVWIREELAEIVDAQPDRDSLSLMIASKREFGAQVTPSPSGRRATQPEEDR
jgi:hypothetical protein